MTVAYQLRADHADHAHILAAAMPRLRIKTAKDFDADGDGNFDAAELQQMAMDIPIDTALLRAQFKSQMGEGARAKRERAETDAANLVAFAAEAELATQETQLKTAEELGVAIEMQGHQIRQVREREERRCLPLHFCGHSAKD